MCFRVKARGSDCAAAPPLTQCRATDTCSSPQTRLQRVPRVRGVGGGDSDRVQPWPTASHSLAYHFPMIADTTRNGCFERAISRHLRERPRARAHVLDIGAGSGLLAMLAVRHGAERVSSLEMVSAMT